MHHPAATIARYWPFANGSGRIVDRFASSVDLGSGEIICKTTDGFSMTVLADDLIGKHLALTGRFDRSPVQALLNYSKPGDVFVDVGANIGYVSGCFLSNIPDGRAICIEPQPEVINLLKRNLQQFGKRSEVHPVALSDDDSEGWLHINSINRGGSRIVAAKDAESVQVKMVNAGKLFSKIDRMDLLKIDVEGMEDIVFQSIENEMLRLKPRAILFEDQTGEAYPNGKIGSILKRSGYKVKGIQKQLLKTRLIEVHSRRECHPNDYLAIRQT